MSAPNSPLRTRIAQNAVFDAERRAAEPAQRDRMFRLHLGASPADMTVLRRPSLGRELSAEALHGVATGLARTLQGEVGQGAAGLAAPQLGRTAPMFGMRADLHHINPDSSTGSVPGWHLWYFHPQEQAARYDAPLEHGVVGEGEVQRDIEGCLSFPIEYDEALRNRFETDLAFAEALKVPRHATATVTGIRLVLAQDGEIPNLAWFEDVLTHPAVYTEVIRYSGFLARVAQHEYAHLKGQLYIDHLPRYYRDRIVSKGRY